ncbi:MAG: hypothetical protein HY319_09395 [Armatimonadetes bacterium]|nr:hypothetical protein [Armatimonadota bacterium]
MIYLSIDVEASGPFPGLFSLVSIGAVPLLLSKRVWSVDHEHSFYQELRLLEGAAVMKKAMEIHKLSRAHLEENGLEAPEAMQRFETYFLELKHRHRKITPAAWPSSFDAPYVGWYCQRFLGRNPLGWGAFDIPSYAMGLFRCNRQELRRAMKQAGIVEPANSDPHNALADAVQQGELLCRLLNYARSGPPPR